jgi:hypothetical protein
MASERIESWTKVALMALLAVGVLGACSAPDGEFLAQPGPAIGWVGEAQRTAGDPDTTTTLPLLTDIGSVTWTNDPLAVAAEGATAVEVTQRIYGTSSGTDRYVQAAARDIATVLPGIDVPGVVPSDVRHVTSQLVFDPTIGRLANDPAAAFGFWVVEPYTQSRSVGQRAVLAVSLDADGELQLVSPEDGCRRFEGRGSCEPVAIGSGTAWWLTDEEGSTLVWYAPPHRYELTMRGDAGLAEDMAATREPLTEALGAG